MGAAQVPQPVFYAVCGMLLGCAILMVLGRTLIRLKYFKRLFVDDYILFFGLVTLVAGTVTMFVNFPLVYLQVQIEAGEVPFPSNFLEVLVKDAKTQDASTVLLCATIYSVKFSFLFFFRLLLQRMHKYYMWYWWTIFAILLPSSVFSMITGFVACPNLTEASLTNCISPGALARQNATLKASNGIDISTDLLLISIPVLILRQSKIPWRKKLAIGVILCLSIFMIICAIVNVSAANIVLDQVDSTWVILWLVIEACTAVIVVCVSAYRTLFTTERSPYTPPSYTRTASSAYSRRRKAPPQGAEIPLSTMRVNHNPLPLPPRVPQNTDRSSAETTGEMFPIEGPGVTAEDEDDGYGRELRGFSTGRPSF